MRVSLCIVFFLLCTFSPLFAQLKIEDWGDITPEDLKMTVYDRDSSAASVVLQDYGHLSCFVDPTRGLSTRLSRHKRIKIFKTDALDKGNIFIPYYTKSEGVSDIDIMVYGADGTKTKVKSENIFNEKLNEGVSAKKIFIPNLQIGSIIEYRYQLESSDILTPDQWFFQTDVPVRLSRFEFVYPEDFEYVSVRFYNAKPVLDVARVTNVETGRGFGNSKLVQSVTCFEYLPAVKPEPYITTIKDHQTHIGFQLKSYLAQNGMVVPVFADWKEAAKNLEGNISFGDQYKNARYYDNITEAFAASGGASLTSPAEVAQAAIKFLGQIVWNGSYHIYPTDRSINKAFEKKIGSSADKNLALVAILRDRGFKAYPILVSTRNHGGYIEGYPILDQFNSVIVGLVNGTDLTIYDATSQFNSANIIDNAHSNYYGWMLDKANPGWVEVKPTTRTETVLYNASLTTDLELIGKMSMRLGGQAGVSFRKQHLETPSGAFLKKRYTDQFVEVAIDSINVESADVTKPVSLNYTAKFTNAAQKVGEVIYLPIMVEKFFDKNPFTSLTRNFPVQFPFPMKNEYILNLTIPDGYTVEDLPAGTKLVTYDGGPQFQISSKMNSDTEIQIRMSFSLKDLQYKAELYDAIRNFFSGLDEKQQSQIVLKKK
jgi:transglutaminase-like putative cysteine protease